MAQARSQIDQVDRQFLDLLAQRMQAVNAIGAVKGQDQDSQLLDPDREQALLDQWVQEAESKGLSGYFVGRILREILNYSRRNQEHHLWDDDKKTATQKLLRVGYQGVGHCYSDMAIGKLFATRSQQKPQKRSYASFTAVIKALRGGELDYALLPVENSISGSIGEVNRLLTEPGISVVDEEVWQVEHCLVGLSEANLQGIRKVRSHPVALQQCQEFLGSLPDSEQEIWHDTAAAAESILEEGDPSIAALCSAEAARSLGMQILRRDVADQAQNFTRFLLLAQQAEEMDPRQLCKTSLIINLNHKEGALAECLQAFAGQNLNLTRLESRPQPQTPWQYQFFVDFEGRVGDPAVDLALDEIRKHSNHLRVLGSYPLRSFEAAAHQGKQAKRQAPTAKPTAKPAALPAEKKAELTPAQVKSLPKHALRPGQEPTVVDVSGVQVGGKKFTLILGPCAVENRQQVMDAAAMVHRHGAHIMRGGAFKPRSSPYSFQGLGFPGLDLLAEAGERNEMPIVTEVLRPEDLPGIVRKAHMVQVGARNMQNFALLKELGQIDRPILLKRGMSATLKELLQAAEYIMAGGNQRVVLCERGIRTFETSTRNTLDISAVPVLKTLTHLPIIVDPSHAAGRRDLVVPMALAAVAAGADGLIVEAHPRPDEALCDKDQALTEAHLVELFEKLQPILASQGRHM